MITGMDMGRPELASGAVLIWLEEGLEPRNRLFEAKPEGVDLRPVAWSRFDLV
jgi:hypothetical protein